MTWLTCAWSHRRLQTRPSTWWEPGDWRVESWWYSPGTFPRHQPDLRLPGTFWEKTRLALVVVTNDRLLRQREREREITTGRTWSWLGWEGGGRWSMTLISAGSFSRHTISARLSLNISLSGIIRESLENNSIQYQVSHNSISFVSSILVRPV